MRALVAATASVLASAAAAQVPGVLGYQGRLLKLDGSPETGVLSLEFALYDASAGGSARWTEQQQVALSDGFYAVVLGTVTAIPLAVLDGGDKYLQVAVGGTALSPRQRVASVAYAVRAGTAASVVGGTVDATSLTVGGAGGVTISSTGVSVGGSQVIDSAGKLTAASGALTSIAVGPGLTGSGTTPSPLAVSFGGAGAAATASRSDHAHAASTLSGLPAGPNLLEDTLALSAIPPGQTNVTAFAAYGPWSYYPYNTATASFTVEDPEAALLAIVQPGSPPWWPRTFKMLRLKFAPTGATEGRLLQAALASDKSGPVTMSAYVRVISGGLSVGQEGSWALYRNATWTRVATTHNAPSRTLGGAYGFGAEGNVFTEALVALPKLEFGSVATPYSEAPRPGSGIIPIACADNANCCPSTTATTYSTDLLSCTVTAPTSGVLHLTLVGHESTSVGSQSCSFGIFVDGVHANVGQRDLTMHTYSTAWIAASTTAAVSVGSGTHTLSFRGKGTGANTCYLHDPRIYGFFLPR